MNAIDAWCMAGKRKRGCMQWKTIIISYKISALKAVSGQVSVKLWPLSKSNHDRSGYYVHTITPRHNKLKNDVKNTSEFI